uniref:Adaptin_N domain-containing protein n=1 Tax=Heligmosomoides polygyrus TaxID=6339 RepID=A0A183FX60_HELPZ
LPLRHITTFLQHYAKRSVMTLTLPVAMKAVGSSNQELVRNTTSYISLAAIHNGKALSHYALQIISYIINVYADNREPFHAHIPQLLSVLRDADCSEKLSLLQLASMIANEKPDLLTPYLAQFDQYLLSPSTCTAVLNIYMSLISQGRAHALAPFHSTLSKACQQPAFNGNLATIYKVGCSVALLFKTASLWLWNIDLDLVSS